MGEQRPGGQRATYLLLPLVHDPKDSVTLLRIDPSRDDGVRIHLHRAVNSAAFGMRFGSAVEPVWEPAAEPTRTLLAPSRDTVGLSEPEIVLAEVGRLLAGVVVGDGGIDAWGFESLMSNDEFVLHLTQLASLHDRLGPARESDVAQDPRVVARMQEMVHAADSHARALRGWLIGAQEVAQDVVANARAEMHERRVQAVLDGLNGHGGEDTQAHTNQDLPRIATD